MSKTTTTPLAKLDYTNRVAKRAQYEAFEFTLTPGGVRVRNGSYADPENHEYTVTIRDGIPAKCTCPADARFDGACKHRVAVAIRRPIMQAAIDQVATDGGSQVREEVHEFDEARAGDRDECEDCLEDFPCWECVRTGKKSLPAE